MVLRSARFRFGSGSRGFCAHAEIAPSSPPGNAVDLVLGELSRLSSQQWHSSRKRVGALLQLSRGPSGKYENLVDVISDKNILFAAYLRLRSRPGINFPEIGSAFFPMDWFTDAQSRLRDGTYAFENYSKTESLRRYGLRATQHSFKHRYTMLMVHLWAMRTKRCEILSGRCAFYDKKKPITLRDFTLDFFLSYRLSAKFRPRETRPFAPAGDMIVQEAMHMALEQIYEPLLSVSAHAYRPGKGCHTMFEEVKSWLGTTWLLEFDVRGFFDKLDKEILASNLREQVEDTRFVELVMKLLDVKVWVTRDERLLSPRLQRKIKKAAEPLDYEDWGVKDSKLAPLLIHIYLQKLDDQALIIQEEQEKQHPGERRLNVFRSHLKNVQPTKQLPVMIRYCRYLDEFFMGVTGSVYVVEKVQGLVLEFLKQKLNIEPDYASYADISFGSSLVLGMRITAAKSTYDPVIEGKILEKRKRQKFRFTKLAEFRKRCWEERVAKLTARAWARGLKKAKGQLKSLERARKLLDRRAEREAEEFAIAKLERGETALAVEDLLNCENAVFYNLAAIGIPEELYRAHTHLTELLERYLRHLSKAAEYDQLPVKRNSERDGRRKELIRTYGAFPIRIFAPVEMIMDDLRFKGMIRGVDHTNSISSLINAPDESIVSYCAALAYGLLNYYRCTDNYIKVKRMVDYQVRWGAILTLAFRHNFSPRKTIVEYKRGPQMIDLTGDVIASLPSTPIISRMGTRFFDDIQETDFSDVMRYMKT